VAREVAVTLNADRRHLDAAQRREVVAALRAASHSYRAIARALGVIKAQAHRDRHAAGVTPVRACAGIRRIRDLAVVISNPRWISS
jgi:hypothetical protein